MNQFGPFFPDLDEDTVCVDSATPVEEGAIQIAIRPDEGGFFAENDDVSVFAFGATPQESISAFLSSLTEKWEGLKDLKDYELTQDAIKARDILAHYFGIQCDSQGSGY